MPYKEISKETDKLPKYKTAQKGIQQEFTVHMYMPCWTLSNI